MSGDWKSGDFDRRRLRGAVRHFAPAHAAESLPAIDLQRLYDGGKRLILLDVDNTLVQWKTEAFSPEVVSWVERAKGMGFGLCIISNTHRLDRLERLRTTLGVETVRGRFKPSRAMFRLALLKFKLRPEQAIMVGDQMMTDVLGANRAGIDAIWVRKMEGKEFGGTRVNRMVERFLTGRVYEALVTPVDEPPGPESARSLQHQVVKFLIVGGSSFVIDYCVKMTLAYAVPFGSEKLGVVAGRALQAHLPFLFGGFETPTKAFWPLAATAGAAVAIVNSFFLNRRWTFEIRGAEGRREQLRRFVAISLVGAAINVGLSSFVNHLLSGDEKAASRVATVVAAVLAGLWNFVAQRRYAFRPTP